MTNIVAFSLIRRQLQSGGEPPDNGNMALRLSNLEELSNKTGERLAALDVRVERIGARIDEGFKHFATKSDVAEAKNSIIMWVVSAVLLAQLLPALLRKFGL